MKDGGEPGLSGWTISAFADNNLANGVLDAAEIAFGAAATAVTDVNGDYTLTLDPGDYIVVETLQATWFESPQVGTAPVNTDATFGLFGYAITLTSGQVETGNDFANFQQATKSGTKYNDLDADGVKDVGEPGLYGGNFAAVGVVDILGHGRRLLSVSRRLSPG